MSSKPVTIYKYHGTGNDFVIIDAPSLDARQLAGALCDRHRGVGADGVIVVEPAEGFDARMTIYNRDGSRPEMCGNGIRCVARHLVEQFGAGSSVKVATDAGERTCEVSIEDGEVYVDVDMGRPSRESTLAWREYELHRVNMGNPHAVVFGDVPSGLADSLGAALNGGGEPFVDGVNIEFTKIPADGRLDVVVYERGVGRTQACGTGACAAAVAAWDNGLVSEGPVEVWLPGGPLRIRRVGEHVWMRGTAELVMTAQLAPTWLDSRNDGIDTEVD